MRYAAWLDEAFAEIGQKEIDGPKSNPRIMEYRKIAGIEIGGEDGSVPWCAIFVNAMLRQVGVSGSGSAMARSFERSKQFIRIEKPVAGCIITTWRKSPQSGSGHVQFDAGPAGESGLRNAIGGNQSDKVSIVKYRPGDNRITGYWWPVGHEITNDVIFNMDTEEAGRED